MTLWGDMEYEVQPLPLDTETADRLLAGRVDPEDAPPGYGPVVCLLDTASADATAGELEHEEQRVAAFAVAVRSSEPANSVSPRRFPVPFALSRARVVAAAVAAALATSAGLASANSLPGAAQDVASDMLAKLGISVPGPNDNAGTHPDGRGNSGTAPSVSSVDNKGSEISELARTTEATGVEKGAVVSTAASDGKSRAGQNGSAESNSSAAANAPATTGKGGEISELATSTESAGVEKGAVVSTAASEGKSQAGQQGSASGTGGGAPETSPAGGGNSTADTASGGRSSAGAGNAASGQSNRP